MSDHREQADYTALAEQIYALDLRVYEILGSALGRVFNSDRERCIRNMVRDMTEHPSEHIVRSEVALIGNMARTIRDKNVRSQVMTEYNEIMQKLMKISFSFASSTIVDTSRQALNSLMLGDRFDENQHLIICISRTYGSAGTQIGYGLADALKINYYDAEIFNTVLRRLEAEEDGLSDECSYEVLEEHKSRKNPGLDQYTEKSGWRDKLRKLNRYHGLPRRDAVFFNQSDLIVDMAKERDFVVMGRCADVVLRNNHIPHISIFITAPEERRARRMSAFNKVDLKVARRQLKQVDHEHSSYYHYYTGLKWGDPNHYDLCINSASYGIQGSIDFIMNMLIANHVKLPHHVEAEPLSEAAEQEQ